jgi:hypothetical protein
MSEYTEVPDTLKQEVFLITAAFKPRRNKLYIVSSFLLVMSLICVIGVYRSFLPGASTYLYQLAGLPTNRTHDLVEVRAALLQKLPIGTPMQQIHAYLEQHPTTIKPTLTATLQAISSTDGSPYVEQHRNDQGLTVLPITCGPGDLQRGIACSIRSDENKITFVCNEVFWLEFITNEDNILINISIRNNSACL